jgi:calmodulin
MSISPEEMRAAFDALDTDKSGNLDQKEFAQLFTDNEIPANLIPVMFKLFDADNDNKVTFTEFMGFMKLFEEIAADPNVLFRRVFDLYDTKKAGKLDFTAIQEIVRLFGLEVTADEAKQVLAAADADGDGLLNFEEFVTALLT